MRARKHNIIILCTYIFVLSYYYLFLILSIKIQETSVLFFIVGTCIEISNTIQRFVGYGR